MIEGLVTVVIPVYNVEKYLDRCVSSVVNQTYKKLEIILVDDGSPDNCPQMCDAWAEKDSRIHVIHKENQGQGIARNCGIHIATGEYICFFDSDDYIAVNTIEDVYNAAQKNKADVVCFGMTAVNAVGRITKIMIPQVSRPIYEKQTICSEFVPCCIGEDPNTGRSSNVFMSACNKMFSMSLINKNQWRFVSERVIISEDSYSLLKLFPGAERVCILPKAFYFYCENRASFSRKYRSDRFEKICHYYKEIVALSMQLGYSKNVAYRLSLTFLSFTISALKQEFYAENPFFKKLDNIKQIIDNDLLQSVLSERQNDKISTRKKVLFFLIKGRRYLLVYILLATQKVANDIYRIRQYGKNET